MKKISKAVITAAGRGTRFLPASSVFQKEMVPVMHKPQLQWVIEEALDSGINDIAIVVREGVDTLEHYLRKNDNLWKFLKETGKESLMDSWVAIREKANITIFKQRVADPYGNGTPFILAKEFISNEPFAAMWGDDIMVHVDKDKPTCLEQMADYFEKYEAAAVMSVEESPMSQLVKGAVYEYHDKDKTEIPYRVRSLIEKPDPGEIPSKMANACRFILSSEVVEELENKIEGKGGEIWLTDAVNRLAEKGKIVLAPPWEGSIWVPVGDPVRWLKANIVVALNSSEYKEEVETLLDQVR